MKKIAYRQKYLNADFLHIKCSKALKFCMEEVVLPCENTSAEGDFFDSIEMLKSRTLPRNFIVGKICAVALGGK